MEAVAEYLIDAGDRRLVDAIPQEVTVAQAEEVRQHLERFVNDELARLKREGKQRLQAAQEEEARLEQEDARLKADEARRRKEEARIRKATDTLEQERRKAFRKGRADAAEKLRWAADRIEAEAPRAILGVQIGGAGLPARLKSLSEELRQSAKKIALREHKLSRRPSVGKQSEAKSRQTPRPKASPRASRPPYPYPYSTTGVGFECRGCGRILDDDYERVYCPLCLVEEKGWNPPGFDPEEYYAEIDSEIE
jgi:hypothetical protein